MPLTAADRTSLLESFRKLAREGPKDDSVLIAATTSWAGKIQPEFGFESGIGRDVLFLADVLRRSDAASESADLARGALVYLQRSNQPEAPQLGALRLLDDAFVAGYAAHAVREKLGVTARYSPPQLRPDEKKKAEAMFMELLDGPGHDDDRLQVLASESVAGLGAVLESGTFRRLRANVQFLAGVIKSPGSAPDSKQIARAALQYVALDPDVIPDHLGQVGFLDDYFVTDLAVCLIDPRRGPWLNLVDGTVAAWPFLNMVIFSGKQAGTPLSEFMLVNAALICPAVRGSAAGELTHLVLPRVGPVPLVLGVLGSLAQLWKWRTRSGGEVPFEVGQRVKVDGDAIRTFVGCQMQNGKLHIGLEETRMKRGVPLSTVHWLPIQNLHRLVPADQRLTTRRKLKPTSKVADRAYALDYLFLSPTPVVIPPDLPQVVLAGPVGLNRELAEEIFLFGQRICDAIPMGSLSNHGESLPWSTRFGSTKPAILVIPDLDRACEYVEGASEGVALVVVDASGRNSARKASLSRLGASDIPVLSVTSQADASETLADQSSPMIWEWDKHDIDSVLVEAAPARSAVSPVERFEREVSRALSATVSTVRVKMDGVQDAYEALRAFEHALRERGSDVPAQLEDAHELAFHILTRLLRFPFLLADHPRMRGEISKKLSQLSKIRDARAFMTATEFRDLTEAESHLRKVYNVLERKNPKSEVLATFGSDSQLTVVCGDVDLLERVKGVRLLPIRAASEGADSHAKGVFAISGWFGRVTMNRLLRPPFASPLSLLLEGIECEWFSLLTRRIQQEDSARRAQKSRSRLFPAVEGWNDGVTRVQEPFVQAGEPLTGDPVDSVESRILDGRRKRLTSLAQPGIGDTAVDARLVVFDGGHAFLTDDYKAKLATHLLETATKEEDAELELVPASSLKPGDVVLFLKGSSRDVIRVVADKLLSPEDRPTASLWRSALLKYREKRSCTIESVWRSLRDRGCTVSESAVRNWFEYEEIISPLRIDRELQAIVEVTEDERLKTEFSACREAITRVKGAHLRASNQLARLVLQQAVDDLKLSTRPGGTLELGEGIVLTRVRNVDPARVQVKSSVSNKLLEGATWQGTLWPA